MIHCPFFGKNCCEFGRIFFELEVTNRKYDMTLAYFEIDGITLFMCPDNFDELKNNQLYSNYLAWSVAANRLVIFYGDRDITGTSRAKKILEKYLEKIE
jgi:hypothetical protein